MYTCRQVSEGMHGLALGIYTITFITLCSEELRARASRGDIFISSKCRPDWGARVIVVAADLIRDEMLCECPLGVHQPAKRLRSNPR
ncbi:hypothetical protein B0T16DRAFT_410663 [Cercophora newfieldiana]|uniref:Uncharacterized protein n=1 Tax=Cercophora newfieldiana TaxID=92897 RepID=A0AA39YBU1_9PEZI|nr:hypothetical protein B0T16DRAFT_410663 [Cercophora newfieldiana]